MKLKKLTIRGDESIQGLIAYEIKEGWIHIHLVESAPWNIQGKNFLGVGPHLFVIACKRSFELGFAGYWVDNGVYVMQARLSKTQDRMIKKSIEQMKRSKHQLSIKK